MIYRGQIPEHWEIKRLDEVGDIVSGGTPSTKEQDNWGEEIVWITPSDLTGYLGKTISKGKKSISKLGLSRSSARLMPKGSVLFSSRAPIGYVVIAGTELCTNQGFKSIIPNDKVTSDYLFHFLKHSKTHVQTIASGTTFKEISARAFGTLKIPIPPLKEQQLIVEKIEELFSELDTGRRLLETVKEQMKTYRQAVLKWAFEGRLTNENVKKGHLPEGWKWVYFGEMTNNYDGKRIPLSRHMRANRKGEFRYYGATGVVDYVNDYIFNGKYILIGEDGANLLSKSRSLAFLVNGKFWVNNHAHVVQCKPGFSLEYLCYYFNSLDLSTFITGSAQPKLTQANLNCIQVCVPSINEQEDIVRQIETRLYECDKLAETIKLTLNHVEGLKQSILQQAFEGKLFKPQSN